MLQTQIGAATRTDYLYGLNRLASLNGSTKTWYAADALGSVRRTVTDAGVPLGVITYDPWGTPESGTVPTFGFTGEVQDVSAGLVNLRARWYSTGQGRFNSVDPFAGVAETPYSLHQYAYGLSDPVLMTDPRGMHPNKITFLEGVYIGTLIELAFVAGDTSSRHWEFPIPGASTGKRQGVRSVDGFADMVDFAVGEVYEIKPRSDYTRNRGRALSQLQGYINGLNDAATEPPGTRYYIPPPATGLWTAGTSYLSTRVQSFSLWPYGIDPTYNPAIDGYYEIRATLSNDKGIIVYWGEKIPLQRVRTWVPSYAPGDIVDAVERRYRGQRRRVPNFGRSPPVLYPGLSIAEPSYWCGLISDVIQYYTGQLGSLGEQLSPTDTDSVPAIPGAGGIPAIP